MLLQVSAKSVRVLQLKMKRFESALLDAERAIELDSSFAKAHSSRASSLVGLARWTEALAAVDQALELDPTNASSLANKSLINQQLASGGGSASSAGTTPAGASGDLKTFLTGSRAAIITTARSIATIVALMLVFGYLLTPGGTSYWCYSMILLLAGVLHVGQLLQDNGTPQFSTEYAAKLVQHDSIFLAFMCITFSQAAPILLALLPLLLFDAIRMAYWMHTVLTLVAPPTAATASGLVDKGMPYFTGRQDWASMGPQARWTALSTAAAASVAQTQVMLGIFLVVMLLTPSRSFIACLLHWQNLRIQAMVSPRTQEAFRGIDAQLLTLTAHQYCPGAVRSGYSWLRVKLASFAERPQAPAGGGSGGLMSKCSIM